MKKYTLIIDTSASSPENTLYVYEADTITAAMDKLAELDLTFECGYIYCATIGKKEPGRGNNRYFEILRTDDGRKWHREKGQYAYNPESWCRVDDWTSIGSFRKEAA